MTTPFSRRLFAAPMWIGIVLLANIASAGPKIPTPRTYRARRQALAKQLGMTPAVIFGAEATEANARFRQSNRFTYLTGVTEPNAALLLIPRERKAILFLDPGRAMMERWS